MIAMPVQLRSERKSGILILTRTKSPPQRIITPVTTSATKILPTSTSLDGYGRRTYTCHGAQQKYEPPGGQHLPMSEGGGVVVSHATEHGTWAR